jgi:hypothetical protein
MNVVRYCMELLVSSLLISNEILCLVSIAFTNHVLKKKMTISSQSMPRGHKINSV